MSKQRTNTTNASKRQATDNQHSATNTQQTIKVEPHTWHSTRQPKINRQEASHNNQQAANNKQNNMPIKKGLQTKHNKQQNASNDDQKNNKEQTTNIKQ